MDSWTRRTLKSLLTLLWFYDMNRMLSEISLRGHTVTFTCRRCSYMKKTNKQTIHWVDFGLPGGCEKATESKLWQRRLHILLNACFFSFWWVQTTLTWPLPCKDYTEEMGSLLLPEEGFWFGLVIILFY